MKEFNELKYQLEGLQSAVDGMMTGVNEEDVRHVRAQVRYLKEKAQRVITEAELLINQD